MNNIISQEEKDKIDDLCKIFEIENYSINSDGSIDVVGSINMNQCELDVIPLPFNKVGGDFLCRCNRLTSLEGCPKTVGGYFDCRENELTSLEGCPSSVGGSFLCSYNDLTSLKGCPSEVIGDFIGSANMLTSLEGCPASVSNNFFCNHNRLTSLNHCPVSVGGGFICNYNELPQDVYLLFNYTNELTQEEQHIFLKYQSYYTIWTPEFNIDGFNDLIAEIKDGLK
jgi:hypothetical protein